MTACRCVICDCSALARRGEVEPAIATACLVGQGTFDCLDALKRSLCEPHRREWALLLLRAEMGLDAVDEVEFSGKVTP